MAFLAATFPSKACIRKQKAVFCNTVKWNRGHSLECLGLGNVHLFSPLRFRPCLLWALATRKSNLVTRSLRILPKLALLQSLGKEGKAEKCGSSQSTHMVAIFLSSFFYLPTTTGGLSAGDISLQYCNAVTIYLLGSLNSQAFIKKKKKHPSPLHCRYAISLLSLQQRD